MGKELCDECQLAMRCKYEGYINEAARRIKPFSSIEETRTAMDEIKFLIFRAETKSDPCKRSDELETLNTSLQVLDENQGKKPNRSTEQAAS